MCAYNAVVLAAHDVGRARLVRAEAHDLDRGALQAEHHVEAVNDHVEQAQEDANDGVACLLKHIRQQCVNMWSGR